MKFTMQSASAASNAARRYPQYLHMMHHRFTHGGSYWSDNYRLERWDQSIQPVVYLNAVYNGYKLPMRVGDQCWLTRRPRKLSANPLHMIRTALTHIAREYLTLKFLRRPGHRELKMAKLVRSSCSSPHVSK